MLKLDNIKDIDKKSVQSDKTECSSLVMSSDDVTDSDSARANNSITEGALNKTPDSIIDIQEDEIWSSASEAEDLIDDSEAAGENCDNSKGDLKPANILVQGRWKATQSREGAKSDVTLKVSDFGLTWSIFVYNSVFNGTMFQGVTFRVESDDSQVCSL